MPDATDGPIPSGPPTPLSETELAILVLVATGATNIEIARQRSISETTVKKHLANINLKLDTTNRTEAMRRAIELGLVKVPSPQSEGGHEGGAGESHRRLSEALAHAEQRLMRWRRYAVAAGVLAMVTLLFSLASASLRPGPGVSPTVVIVTPIPTSVPAWEPSERLPMPLAGAAAASLESRLLVTGGASNGVVVSGTWVLDLERVGPWQRRADKPTPTKYAGAATVQGRFVVPGGCGQDGAALAVTEIYDPRTDTWSRAADLPAPRCGYGLATLEGNVYVFGGRLSDDVATAVDTVFRYDLDSDRWTEVGRLPFARSDLGVATYLSTVHLVGGWSPEGQRQVSHWIYRPFDTPTWDTDHAQPLPEGRAGLALATQHAVTLADDDRLIVVGGGEADPQSALSLPLSGGAWQPFANLPGYTPQQGASLVTFSGLPTLLLLGGRTAEGRELDPTYTFLRRWKVRIIAPSR